MRYFDRQGTWHRFVPGSDITALQSERNIIVRDTGYQILFLQKCTHGLRERGAVAL